VGRPPPSDLIDTVASWLGVARHIVVLSGAGLSKASGIPTYRDSGGLWTEGSNLKFSDAAAFATNPHGFQRFWAARGAELLRAQPNAAHRALVELQRPRPSTLLVSAWTKSQNCFAHQRLSHRIEPRRFEFS